VTIGLEGLVEPDDPGGGISGLARLIAVHPERLTKQRLVTEVPGDLERPAGPARGGSQPLIR
jgi:hypothetical protein